MSDPLQADAYLYSSAQPNVYLSRSYISSTLQLDKATRFFDPR